MKAARVQVDEIMWEYVHAKQKNVEAAKKAPEGAGDSWTWTAIYADSKLIVSWLVGDRDGHAGYAFMMDLAERLTTRVQLASDGLRVYEGAGEDAFGCDLDYGQLVKVFGNPPREAAARYSPGECKGSFMRTVQGDPDTAHISTSYVERHNLTMRMSMRRFTRLTKAFSKKRQNHVYAVALYFVYYNWCRRHTTTKLTPAQAAGLTDTWHDVEWIVGLVDAATPEPAKPEPKPKGRAAELLIELRDLGVNEDLKSRSN